MRKYLFATVGGLALAVVGAGSASATPYAYATIGFTNFSLTGVLNTSGVTVNTFDVSTSASAGYPGFPAASDTAGPIGGNPNNGSDVLEQTSGPGPFPGQNVYTQALTASSGTRGDSVIAGAINNNATANDVAEGRLTVVPGGASSTAGTTTGINITFTTSGGAVRLTFDASDTAIATTSAPGDSASAQTNASFTIANSPGTAAFSFTFAPSALQLAVSANGVGGSQTQSNPSTLYDTGTINLPAGTYQLSLLSGTQERLLTAVVGTPEPASMAIIGSGLVAAGLIRLRRKSRG